jgi:NAD(P)-dependent dehydrogenase (short-subunit alcohol dehydrogenase family)
VRADVPADVSQAGHGAQLPVTSRLTYPAVTTAATVFLVSEDAAYVNGAPLSADGGLGA